LPFLKGVLTMSNASREELQNIAINTTDHREGVAAFLQKRPAAFTGH
jgi:enoyl-CoA hydratase/carnithine racemase